MKKKILLVILVIFLTIGYAAVNTNLFIEVYSSFAFNESDLNVYFSGAYLDDEDYSNEVISEDKKSIVVSGESLVSNGSMVISYDITNASTSYDAIVNVECVSSVDGVTFVSTDENLLISAREVGVSSTNVSGSVTEVPTITCELKVSASGRTEASNASLAEADEYVVYGTLTDSSGNSLANANVVIYSETPHYATTDEDGYLFYNGIEKGSHEIYYVDDTLENIKSMSKDEVKSSSTINGKFTTRSNGVIALTNGSIKEFGSMEVTPFCESLVGTTWKYEYTGSEQSFLTYCDGNYKVELWGASGSGYDSANLGGLGGYTKGNIDLLFGSSLYVYVGEGKDYQSYEEAYNGGGKGLTGYDNNTYQNGFSGGGATDIRLVNGEWNNFDSLKSRIMVAAAGGGVGHMVGSTSISVAGYGGGLEGASGVDLSAQYGNTYTGLGATQISGGYNVSALSSGKNIGSFGKGAYNSYYQYGAGGGGGYYGGGASIRGHGGAGGGSSFISGHSGCDAITEASTEDNVVHTGQATHFSGYAFTNTIMIDGAGYSWTNEKGSTVVGMPTHDGTSTMTGNTGNGYAKITFVSYKK